MTRPDSTKADIPNGQWIPIQCEWMIKFQKTLQLHFFMVLKWSIDLRILLKFLGERIRYIKRVEETHHTFNSKQLNNFARDSSERKDITNRDSLTAWYSNSLYTCYSAVLSPPPLPLGMKVGAGDWNRRHQRPNYRNEWANWNSCALYCSCCCCDQFPRKELKIRCSTYMRWCWLRTRICFLWHGCFDGGEWCTIGENIRLRENF